MLRQLQNNLDEGLLSQLYRIASIEQDEILVGLRKRGVEAYSLGEISRAPIQLLDQGADEQIRRVCRSGALSGASFGLTGVLSIAPEIGYVLVALLRLSQRISLTYGYEVETSKGRLDLWTALARGLGIRVSLEGLESDLYRGLPVLVGKGQFRDPILVKVVQKVLVTVGLRMSTRFARMVPLVGAGVGGIANYAWFSMIGRRLKDDFRTRHQLRHLNLSDPGLSEEIAFTLDHREG